MNKYRKLYAAALAAVGATVPLVADGVSSNDLVTLIALWGGVGAVYFFPNEDSSEA